ncbi:MAG TPA: DUF2809 domain-containing protein [bacterium]|nr:DUF2809 domain-containing protein [bacterium]
MQKSKECLEKRHWTGPYRRRLFLVILILIPVGLATKWTSEPYTRWMNHHAGGVVYVLFWSAVVSWIWPRISAFRVALWVFLVTCALEILQLWHPPVLQTIRSTFVGRALIGTHFSWPDFPHYAAGCVLAWWWIRRLQKNRLCDAKHRETIEWRNSIKT